MSKKIFIPLIVFVIFIVIIAVCFKFFDTNSNFHTYKNKEYGFEIKYPKYWYSYEKDINSSDLAVFSTVPSRIRSTQEFYDKYYYGEEGYGIVAFNAYIKEEHIRELENQYNKQDVLEALALSLNAKSASTSRNGIAKFQSAIEEITIEGRKLIKSSTIIIYEKPFHKESNYILYYILDKDNKGIFVFQGEFTGKNKEKYAADFYQIISSFKFLP
jgi:hypothetical protein